MLGQMMNFPLTIGSLVDHAARYHGTTRIVSVNTVYGIESTTELVEKAKEVASKEKKEEKSDSNSDD